jgi:hypothetical protein
MLSVKNREGMTGSVALDRVYSHSINLRLLFFMHIDHLFDLNGGLRQ